MLMVFVLYFILPFIQTVLYLNNMLLYGIFDVINIGASIFALHWLLANILFSAKVPLFPKIIPPYDKRIRLHIFSTIGITLFLAYHAIYKIVQGAFINFVSWALLGFFVLLLFTAFLWIPFPGFRKIRSWILGKFRGNKDLPYGKSKKQHTVLVLLIEILLVIHIISAGLFSVAGTISSILYFLMFFISIGAHLISLTNIFRVKAEIISIKRGSGNFILNLKPLRKIRYKSGQFAFISVDNGSAKKMEHPFSYLSYPGESFDGDGVEPVSFAIRISGKFTKYLSTLEPGTKMRIRSSFGSFYPSGEARLCFISSGIGLVPSVSILKYLHSTGDTRPIDFFIAVDTIEEIPEWDKILEIDKSMENLTLHTLIYSSDGLQYSEKYLREKVSEPEESSYYLCSSPKVRRVVVKSLKAMGVRRSKIHYESFSF